jgi:serine/threonine-protein kinase RsbW
VLIRELGFPVVCVLTLGRLFGVRGVGAGFITAGALSIATCLLMPVIIKRKLPKKTGDFIMLDDDFGSKPEDTFEASVHNMKEVAEASSAVMEFYKQHEMDKRTSLFVSLFLEEMLSNVIEYGYTAEGERNADIRVICSETRQVIRIRDDGKPFDPLEWHKKNHPEDPASGLGIRMVVGLTKDVKYVPAMGLNNLMLIL